jgi:hypothetical protein
MAKNSKRQIASNALDSTKDQKGKPLIFRFRHAGKFYDTRWSFEKIEMKKLVEALTIFENRTIEEVFSSIGNNMVGTAKTYSIDNPNCKHQSELRKVIEVLGENTMSIELSRLHVSSIERLWGLREDNIFYIFLWDPKHEIYPTKKK